MESRAEVVHQDGAWRIRVKGEGTSAVAYSTEAEALEAARRQSEQAAGEG